MFTAGAVLFLHFSFRNMPFLKNVNHLIIIAILLISAFVLIRDVGTETHLVCFVFSVFLYLKSLEIYKQNLKYPVLKSLLMVFLFLSRTDFILTVIPFMVISDIALSGKELKSSLIINYSIFLATILILYLSFNYLFFGNIITTSGYIEYSIPDIVFYKNLDTYFKCYSFMVNRILFLSFFIITLLSYLLAYCFNKTEIDNQGIDKFLLIVGIGIFWFIVFNFFFNNYGLKEWYLTFPAFVSIIILVRLLNAFKINLNASYVISLIVLLTYFYVARLKDYKFTYHYYYASQIKERVNKNDLIFQFNLTGITGFFSQRNVIDGTGEVSSFEYLKYTRENKLGEFLNKFNVKYYSTCSNTKINPEDSLFFDAENKILANNFSFEFHRENLFIQMPFYYNHPLYSEEGVWLMYRLK